MLSQYQILDQTVDTRLHPPHQRVLLPKELAYKCLNKMEIFYHAFYVWGSIGMLLCKIQPSTATDSLSHCHNRNLHVFFAQKQYLNHWYSQYIDAFIEGGDIADTCIFVW